MRNPNYTYLQNPKPQCFNRGSEVWLCKARLNRRTQQIQLFSNHYQPGVSGFDFNDKADCSSHTLPEGESFKDWFEKTTGKTAYPA